MGIQFMNKKNLPYVIVVFGISVFILFLLRLSYVQYSLKYIIDYFDYLRFSKLLIVEILSWIMIGFSIFLLKFDNSK